MEDLISFKDAPLSVPNEVPLYLMSKEMKKDITVVLSGEGADELFGGYGRIFRSPFDYYRLRDINKLGLSENERRVFLNNFYKKYKTKSFDNEIDHLFNIYSYTKYEEKNRLLNINIENEEQNYKQKFNKYFAEISDSSYYNKMMYSFEKIHLLGLLHRVDTTTMAASVEARVPFVDHKLVEFAYTIPLKYKLKWKSDYDKKTSKLIMSDKISEEYDTPKYLLKKSFENLLPNKILYRKKVGFPVPLNTWFGDKFNNYAKDLLLSKQSKERGIYNIKSVEKILNDKNLVNNHNLAMKIWMMINLEIFINKYKI